VAITSGVKDMQAVLNLVWTKLLPAMQPAPLAEAPQAHEKLRQKLATLVVPVVQQTASSPLADRVSGKRYVFPANDRKIDAIALECGDGSDDAALIVQTEGVEQRIVCGGDRWVKGRLSLAPGLGREVAACGAWTADDTFTAEVCYYETPHCLTARLKFSDDQLILDSEMNVSFGPTEQPQLTGSLRP